MSKIMQVNTKFPPDMFDQLQGISDKRGISLAELIREAVNVYLTGDNSISGLANRVGNLEKNITVLVETMKSFAEKNNENFTLGRETERVRLQGIADFIKKRLSEHEENDKERLTAAMKHLVESLNPRNNPIKL